MERLTNKKEADAQRKAYVMRLKQGYPRNIPEERFLRLAAYEDTGLEPEEIRPSVRGHSEFLAYHEGYEQGKFDQFMEDSLHGSVSPDHLCELVQAKAALEAQKGGGDA